MRLEAESRSSASAASSPCGLAGRGWPRNRAACRRLERMGRDSNPRYPNGYSSFQDCRLRPLGHPSSLRAGRALRHSITTATRSQRGKQVTAKPFSGRIPGADLAEVVATVFLPPPYAIAVQSCRRQPSRFDRDSRKRQSDRLLGKIAKPPADQQGGGKRGETASGRYYGRSSFVFNRSKAACSSGGRTSLRRS